MKSLLLASGSPRRSELLRQLGLDFGVVVPEIDERIEAGEAPRAYVSRMSAEKSVDARHRLAGFDAGVVLCADTIVVVDDEILGKPRDREEGLSMLDRLSGRSHVVLTSVTLAEGASEVSFTTETIVAMRQLTDMDKEFYWATGEPGDKAGAYGIQGIGAVLIESVNGSYTNVVGLPLMETALALKAFGIDCLRNASEARIATQE